MLVKNDGRQTTPSCEQSKTEITVSDLIIFKSITQPLEDYKRNALNVSVGKWMAQNGYVVSAGDTIPYVVMNFKSKDYDQKAWHPSRVETVADTDVDWYVTNQLIPPLTRLCEHFSGISSKEIEDALGVKSSGGKKTTDDLLDELFYSCPNCGAKTQIGKTAALTCKNCKTRMTWKYVANNLTRNLRDLLEKWTSRNDMYCTACNTRTRHLSVRHIPLCSKSNTKCTMRLETQNVDVYRHLKSFLAKIKMMTKCEGVTNEMTDIITDLLDLHGLNRIQFSSIARVQPWE